MLDVLRDSAYRKLFSAQVIALVGTGLLTVALGLLAFDLAGSDAGLVLGTALTIKMLAYVGVAPVVSAITGRIARKKVLIGADVARAAVALSLPFVGEIWQIYVLIFVLQAASATFTPTFQAVIPEVLPDEGQYTRALSLSRLAYDLEALVSPALAAALLTVMSYHNLFVGTFVGFVGSALLVLATSFPSRAPATAAPFLDRLTRGARIFWRVRELRSLLFLNLVVATSTAMVIVNTVVLVQGRLERPQTDVAILLAAYGGGSMLVALCLPKVLDRSPDHTVMLTGAAILPVGLVAVAVITAMDAGTPQWIALIGAWAVLGAATALVSTPSSRLLRRASDEADRPAVFAAQFSLSHACFILTYPTAGVLGALVGLPWTAVVLAALGAGALAVARTAWPAPRPVPALTPAG
ncbi:MFS transporter [Sanguibacter inulinus]|uniref:MFS transporter n=1 Tax=Sanguibacter inulinus TaxID=60922 RepID=A0A853ET41_9MICO|nr:MFS transporter [Sanguibacter inulinus]MBF0721769.1 MFS transporter [Sanguibacter inulinus]NYS92914.1 MFS transporter [Sanguibacter inulinus]